MEKIFEGNINRWDIGIRVLTGILSIVPAFTLPDGQFAAAALLMPYLLGTALMSWDPVYGLVSWATEWTGKTIRRQHPRDQPAIA